MLLMAFVLKYHDFSQKSQIETDALQVGLGAVLTQEYKIKGKKISMHVFFARKSFKGAKRQYNVTE